MWPRTAAGCVLGAVSDGQGLRALAENAYERAVDDETDTVSDTYMLSPHFEGFVSSLFRVADRCVV